MDWKDKLSVGIAISIVCFLFFGFCAALAYGECGPNADGTKLVCKR